MNENMRNAMARVGDFNNEVITATIQGNLYEETWGELFERGIELVCDINEAMKECGGESDWCIDRATLRIIDKKHSSCYCETDKMMDGKPRFLTFEYCED